MDWDDFKFFSAVARCGSVRAAARDLRVHPSTVTRRIEHFEARLGVKLFARRAHGLVLTPSGADAVHDLERVEADLGRIERSLKDEELAYAGEVRVAIPEFLLVGGVFQDYGDFVAAYSGITVEWHLQGADAALSAGVADLGIQVTAEPPLDLVGRRIGVAGVTVYGSDRYRHPAHGRRARNWVEWQAPGELAAACAAVRAPDWADAPVVSRCQTISQSLALVRAGVGSSALPCLVGEREPGLQRMPGATVATAELWMLTAPEVRYARRIRVLADYLAGAIDTRQGQLAGHGSEHTGRRGTEH